MAAQVEKAALLLLYCCSTAALLLLYCCFTDTLLLLYSSAVVEVGAQVKEVEEALKEEVTGETVGG